MIFPNVDLYTFLKVSRELREILTSPAKLAKFSFFDAVHCLEEMVNSLLDATRGYGHGGVKNGREDTNLQIARETLSQLKNEGIIHV